MCYTSKIKLLQGLHVMVAETFKLSNSLKVIQQPYLRAMKKMQGLLCLSLKCSQLWREVKYLFNHSVMFHWPRFPVQALMGRFHNTRVSSHLSSAFVNAGRGKLTTGTGLCNFNCGWHCCTDFIICGLSLRSTF